MPGDHLTTKADWRAVIKARLASLPAAEIERQSLALCEHLLVSPLLASARTIMVFAPLKHEADVRPVAAAWAMMASAPPKLGQGAEAPRSGGERASRAYRLCVPRTDWPTRHMDPVVVTEWDSDLVLSRLGLREPRADLPVVPLDELDVVLVPGLAFDRAGRRLGRGAGFYDRFLARLPGKVVTVGIALEGQIVDAVPVEPHDARVQWVATPGGLLNCEP